ncbi:prohead protease/major capsid protein fusion protein [Tahibacter harae]|uniref:Uncharacterized protein n=1 Tax=Tahibacter harae TaxID=2963937 RepID=A0ABT1QS61_9GAMM|nr:prohead protease/major capsid protein fusion protein [Tahibacter harae]MCQ4165135.1 hypothetical protein [Tahibacter harae]
MPQLNQRQRVEGPPLARAVAVDASAVNRETRTVRLSFSSEDALVPRYNWWDEAWLERLGHKDDEVDLSFIDSGNAPALWGHDRWSRSSMVGVVEKAWIEGSRCLADVRISQREDADSLLTDIEDGIVRNVSVGYTISERTLVKQNKDGPDEYRVTSWRPLEISFVPLPADESVGVGRSDDATPHRRYIVTTIEETKMPNPVQNPPAPQPDVTAVAAEAARAAVAAERARTAEIQALVARHDLGEQFLREALAGADTIDAIRAKALEAMAARQPTYLPSMRIPVDQQDKQRAAATAWLLHRGGERIDVKELDGNNYRGMSLLDVARECLQQRGISPRGMTNTEIAARAVAHSTSDFPIVMQNVMHKTMDAAYLSIPFVWREFCAIGSLSDFRPHYRYRMGSFGNLAEVKENGLFTYGTLSDAERESIVAKTKGKLLSISRQMIINDDLGAFIGLTREMGQGAGRTVEDDVFSLLLSNPNTGDGGALFNATANTTPGGHANLNASGAAPTVAGFDAARQAMAVQRNVGGTDYISVSPAIWLGPVSLAGQAKVVNEAQYDIDQSNKQNYPNKSRGLVQKVVESPRLTGNQWYLFADPRISAVLEVGFLNGQQTPYSEMKEGFEQDGVTWKIRHDYGVAAVGFRGAHKVTW